MIAAARRGDEEAFRLLIAPLRSQLHAQCWRMLASPHDAEDAVQESLLRAWRALPRFDGRAAFHTWLYRIAANVCLTALQKRTHSVPIDEEDEPAAPDPGYETQEAAAQATSAALHLPANQRAALILRDVLGFPGRDAASRLGTTPASVNSALQRARANLEEREPVDDERLRDAVEGFVAAFQRGDVDTLIGIAADSTLSTERSWAYSAVPAY